MASLARIGAEPGDTPTPIFGGTVTEVSSPVNSGTKAWQIDSIASESFIDLLQTTTHGVTYYYRAYFYLTSAPGSLTRMLNVYNAPGFPPGSIRLSTTRTLNLYDYVGNYVTDASSATAPLALNQWHYIELGVMVPATGNGLCGFRHNGVQIVPMTAANTGNETISRVRVGKDTPTTIGLTVDDIGINDSTGSTNNSWVGSISGAIVWEDNFERTTALGTKWREAEQATTAYMAQTSTTRARDGTRSGRFELRNGDIANGSDERQQLNGAFNDDGTPFEPKEGDDYYMALSLWFEPGFPGLEGDASWQVFASWTSFDVRGSGPLKIGHGGANGRLCIEGVDTSDPAVGNGYYWMNDSATATGGWHDFVIHVKFSQNPATGFLELWHKEPSDTDYVKQTLTDGSTKRFFSTLLEPKAFMKVGLYRSNLFTSTEVMYMDRYKIGTTFASVAIDNTGGSGSGALVTPSWVTPPTPTAGSTVSGNTTIQATTTDNTKVQKVEYFVETARNYFENPSTEVDITGWTANGSPPTLPTRMTDDFQFGLASLKITGDAAFDGASYSLSGTAPLPENKTWTFSCWIKTISRTGSDEGVIVLRELTAGGEEIGYDFISFPLNATGWNKYSITRTFTSMAGGALTGTIGTGTVGAGTVGGRGTSGSGGDPGVDAIVQIVTFQSGSTFDIRADGFVFSDNNVDYFNGDWAGAVWLGTPHASASSMRTIVNTKLTAPYSFSWDTTALSNDDTILIAKITQLDSQTVELTRDFSINNAQVVDEVDIKLSGTFVKKPILIKINGVWVGKPLTVMGGTGPPPPVNPVTMNWTSPNSGATVSGLQTVTVQTSDDSRVDKVEFRNGSTLIQTVNNPPWMWQWNTTTVGDGTVTLKAKAIHNDASADVEITRDFVVDNIAAPLPPTGPKRMIPVADWGMNDVSMRNGITRTSTTTQPFVPGSTGWVQAIRCVFDETFTLEEFWTGMKGRGTSWWHGGIDGTIYGSGTGGILNCRLVPVSATGQPRFTDTANMLGEELNIDPATRYNAVEASYPARFGFSFTTGDGPMLWWFKPRKNGVAPAIQAGVVYAFCLWNSHPQPGVNFMSVNNMTIREYIWPPSTPGISTWPSILKSGGSGRAKSPNVVDNMDADCPGAIGGMDPREVLMYSANGGSTFPWTGRTGLSLAPAAPAYAGAAEPSDDGARIPCIAYSKQGSPNVVIKGDKGFGYSSGNPTGTSNTYTSPAFPRATTLTHAWAYARSGTAVGNIVVTHMRGTTTIGTATASGGSLNDTTGGMEVGPLTPNLHLLTGDHYIANPSGNAITYVNDANNKPWTSVERVQVGCLPNPFYVGGTGTAIDAIPAQTTEWQGYWGARIDGAVYGTGDAPWDNATWNTFESHTGKAVSLLHFGQPAPWNQAWTSSPFNLTTARGAIPMCSMSLDGDTLANINSGARDAVWTTWANAAEAWGKPFLLRLMWEMNGTWYNYGSEAQQNPTAFRNAWIRIYNLVTAAGATNVSFHWCPNTVFPGSTALSSLYPGDAYVDWTGFDAYNWGTNNAKGSPDVWKTFTTVAQTTYDQIKAIAPSKPMALGEVGCTEIGGNKATWITDMFSKIPTNFPLIKAIAWFNWNIPDSNGTWDWQIESSSAAQTSFANAIAPSHYLGNNYGNLPSLTKVPSPVPLITADYPAAILGTTGLVGYWRLGETSGTNANDEKGTNDGTYDTGVTLGGAGAIGDDTDKAPTLSGGTDGLIGFANPSLTGAFSLEAWVFCTGQGTVGPGDWGSIFGYSGTRRLLFDAAGPTGPNNNRVLAQMGGADLFTPVGSITQNAWNHIVYTFGGGLEKIYINGTERASQATASGPTWNSAFFIGATADPAGSYAFKGRIDEPAIYNVALPAATIASHYAAGAAVAPTIWEDDFERTDPKGTSPQKWGNIEQKTGTDHMMQTSTLHARDGTRSLRTELRDNEVTSQGHSRMMLLDFLHPTGTYPANVLRAQDGDEWYQAMSFWFQDPFPGLEGGYSWNVFFEWTSFDADGNGPLKLVHGGSQGRLAIEGKGASFNTPPGGYYWMNNSATATNGWHDFVFHIKWSQNPAVGFLELWHKEPTDTDYVKQNFIQGTGAPGTKIFFATLLDTEAYMKLGQYRATQFTQTAIMFADRVKIGSTFASVALPPAAPSGSGTIIWEDDFERTTILGTSPQKWGSLEEPTGTGHQAQTSTAHARDGTKAARFQLSGGELVGGNSRMQLTDILNPTGTYPGNQLRPKEGDDWYVALSMWFESPFPGLEGSSSWNVFLSFTSFDARGSGPLKIAHGGANGRLSIEGVDSSDPPGGYYWMNNVATATGGWHDMVLHVKFSQNPAIGFIEFWHKEPSDLDYVKQTFINGTQKRFFATLLDTEAYLKLGEYRATSFTQTATMFADRMKIGTTFESVAIQF